MALQIKGPSGNIYEVVNEKGAIGGTEHFSIYECNLPGGQTGLLKITTAPEYNGLLDKEAYVLEQLTSYAKDLEADYARETGGAKPPLNNHFFFPNLVESFIDSAQNNRRVLVVDMGNVAKTLSDLVPLSEFGEGKVLVDPRSSAWIMGKLLKLLVFTQSNGVLINEALTDENILINKERHFVCIFDWSTATLVDTMTQFEKATEVSSVAKVVLALLGADDLGKIPSHEQLVDDRYQDLYKELLSGAYEGDTLTVHTRFYELIRSLWPRGFYPFTTIS